MLKRSSNFILLFLLTFLISQNSWALLTAEQTAEYRQLLSTKDPKQIYRAVKKIEAEMPQAPMIENALLRYLGMEKLDFRHYVAEVLARYDHPAGKRYLVNLIKNAETPLNIKLQTLLFFGEIHSREGLQALQQSLDDTSTYIQITALQSLIKYGKFPTQKEVESLYLSFQEGEKRLLLKALADGNRDHYLEFFKKVVLGNNPRLSRQAFHILIQDPTDKAKFVIHDMANKLKDQRQIILSTLYLHEYLGNSLTPIKEIYESQILQGRKGIIRIIHSQDEKYTVAAKGIINILLEIESDPNLIDTLKNPSPKVKPYDELRKEMEEKQRFLYQERLKELS